MMYSTMVLPLFEYSAVVWDSCGQGSKSYLDELNRRAACIIEGRAVKSDELSTIFGWPHLQAKTKYQGRFRMMNGARAYNSLPSNIRAVKDFK